MDDNENPFFVWQDVPAGTVNHPCVGVEEALKMALMLDALGSRVEIRVDDRADAWTLSEFIELARPILAPRYD